MELQTTKKMRQIGTMCEALRAFALAGIQARLTCGKYGIELSVYADSEEDLKEYAKVCSWFTSKEDKVEERHFPSKSSRPEFYVIEIDKEYDDV